VTILPFAKGAAIDEVSHRLAEVGLAVPLALTNCLYWSVAWLEAEGDEYHRALVMSDYHNWALLFIGAWFLAGAIPSAAVVRIFFAPKAGKGRHQRGKGEIVGGSRHIQLRCSETGRLS
jgi:hypothetical protein